MATTERQKKAIIERDPLFFLYKMTRISAVSVFIVEAVCCIMISFLLILSLSGARIMQYYYGFVVTSNSYNINYVLPTGVYSFTRAIFTGG